MALQFYQLPKDSSGNALVITNYTPLVGYTLYYDASILALFYYQLVLEVRLNNSTGDILGIIKQRRNGYGPDITSNYARAFFDLRDLINSQLVATIFDQNDSGVPFNTIHKVGKNTSTLPFSLSGDSKQGKTQIQEVYVKGYQQYSTTANASPELDLTGAVEDTLYYLEASLPLTTARGTAEYMQTTQFNNYNGNVPGDLFLSDLEASFIKYESSNQLRNYVQETDYHTVAFLNDNSNFQSNVEYIEIQYYTASGASTAIYIQNVDTAGGQAPASTTLDSERLLYYGCGPGNLEGYTDGDTNLQRPSNNPGWLYYTVRGSNSTGSVYRTKKYYFIKEGGSCKGFKVRRLAWTNTKGGYDYFNFKMKSTQTIDITRNNYNSLIGNYNASRWYYNNTQRGKTTRQTTAIKKEVIQTDWITEQDANLLQTLLISTNIDIVENADTEFTEAVIINDSSFVKKTTSNDKLIKYTFNIEYANPINTNS